MGSSDSAVRYWAATGLLITGSGALQAHGRLREALDDESLPVRIVAAEALGRYGDRSDLTLALPVLLQAANLEENSVYVAIMALIAIDQLDEKAKPFEDRIRDLPDEYPTVPARMSSYVPRLKDNILADLR